VRELRSSRAAPRRIVEKSHAVGPDSSTAKSEIDGAIHCAFARGAASSQRSSSKSSSERSCAVCQAAAASPLSFTRRRSMLELRSTRASPSANRTRSARIHQGQISRYQRPRRVARVRARKVRGASRCRRDAQWSAHLSHHRRHRTAEEGRRVRGRCSPLVAKWQIALDELKRLKDADAKAWRSIS